MTYLIVPIAGKSSRFKEFTSDPKWSLYLGESSGLERAVQSLLLEKPLGISRLVFLALEQHKDLLNSLTCGGDRISDLGEIVTVKSTPKGQALSVAAALKVVPHNKSFFVWNGDSALEAGWSQGLSVNENWLLVSKLPGSHWSFVDPDGQRVLRTAEKLRISSLASLGLYKFENKKIYLGALKDAGSSAEEVFVAPLYNHMISEKVEVTYSEISPQLFQPFGTPRELVETCLRNQWSVPSEFSGLSRSLANLDRGTQ